MIFVSIVISGCGPEPKDTSQDVAVAFFDAIYNQNDINKAQKLCTADLAKELSQYVTAKNVARRVFNMSFDSVEIDAALGDMAVREEFETSGVLTILFTGHREGRIYKDLKKIKLIEKDNIWFVDEILPDPFPH